MSEPKIYRKKPVEVKAMRVPDYIDWEGVEDLLDWLGDDAYLNENDEIVITTLEGDMHAFTGDYVIRGVNGEFYPCKPDIFAKTYEKEQQ